MIGPMKIGVKKPEAKRGHCLSQTRKPVTKSSGSLFDHVLFLHRTIGNQAVEKLYKAGLLKAKLKISQPGDIYEQEADRIAEQVMRMPEPEVALKPT